MPRNKTGRRIRKLPTPAARIATSSLSPCIFVRPMTMPTSAAIGHVNAITFGIKAIASCHIRLLGIFALKKISENRLACWTKRITLSSSHAEKKYGTIAPIKYLEIVQLVRIEGRDSSLSQSRRAREFFAESLSDQPFQYQ